MLKYDDLKTIKINSLSEYIKEIEALPSTCYYRGEDKDYFSQTSTALRRYTGSWKSKKPFPFLKMINEFYKEVAYKLNDDRVDFIAFAQHYGIPTNLLDITTSPLTALYFACQGDKTENGYVYTLNEAYIDITELIHMYPNKNLIDKIFSNTPQELTLLVPLITEFKNQYPDEFNRLNNVLIEDYLHYFNITLFDKEEAFQKLLKKNNSDSLDLLVSLYDTHEELKDFIFDNYDIDVYNYICLQYLFLKKAKTFNEVIHNINFLPNMIYQPIMKFERGRSQDGLFMYQGYMSYIEPVYDYFVLATQRVHFNHTILEIHNKNAILKSLDKLGINQKTLFCDYDSIAKYIKEKYSDIENETV